METSPFQPSYANSSVRTSSGVRLKHLFLILIFLFLFILGFWWWFNRKITLSSPQSLDYKPDLKSKITPHFVSSPPLSGDLTKSAPNMPTHLVYLVYNLDTKEVLASSGLNKSIAPGSFSKLLTSMVALDLLPEDQLISITPQIINKEPTVLGLKVGEQLTVKELVHSSISTSANDAAATLAEGAAYQLGLNLSDYLSLMNHKATLLGLTNSYFVTPEGYDAPSQKTTLSDLVKLIDASMAYPIIASGAASDREDLLSTNTHGFYYLPNWNGLLGVYPGVFGLKIARTEEAGYATIVLSKRNNIQLATIVSGAKTLLERDQTAAKLLDLGFGKYKISPVNLTEKQLKDKYQIWNDLAAKIRAELKSLNLL